MQGMFERPAAARLQALARAFPAVAILGARQAGKTTLARTVFPGFACADLEDPAVAQRFRDDPRTAIDAAAGSGGLILDEAQAVPQVFAALRGAIDADRQRNGRFVVLGSSQPSLV